MLKSKAGVLEVDALDCFGNKIRGSGMVQERKADYSKLWKLLIDRKIKKTDLKREAQISPGTYAKLNRDEFVSMEVLARICAVLDCDIGDIVEMIPVETVQTRK